LKIEYKYLEQELDDTKTIPSLREEKFQKNAKEVTEKIAIQINGSDNKKQKTIVLILSCILLCLMVLFAFLFLILPNLKKVKEVVIPDVSNISIIDAETELKALNLEIDEEVKEINSDTIPLDFVIKTSPGIGRTVKEGTTITLYVSIGTTKIKIEDYIGKDASNVEGALEILGLNVLIEKMSVSDPNDYDDNEIVEQSIKKDVEVEKGETITLYIANKAIYPNMVSDTWNEDAASEFADMYDIELTVVEKVSTIAPGTVIYQSRAAGTNIITGSSLTIHVAVAEVVEN
jgi:serine/threonine-protein kinase